MTERCRWTNEPFENVVAGIRSMIDPNLLNFLSQYEFGKDKQDISDEEIMEKVKERCETKNDTYISASSVLFRKQLKLICRRCSRESLRTTGSRRTLVVGGRLYGPNEGAKQNSC